MGSESLARRLAGRDCRSDSRQLLGTDDKKLRDLLLSRHLRQQQIDLALFRLHLCRTNGRAVGGLPVATGGTAQKPRHWHADSTETHRHNRATR